MMIKPQIFLDCDGVLADFDTHFESIFDIPAPEYEDKHGSEKFWNDIQSVGNFYLDLPLMEDAKELYEAVKDHKPIILTGCPEGGWAEPQKRMWGHKNFYGVPMITCMARNKSDYCLRGDVLVDDREGHKQRWIDAGGIWITHTSAENSIKELKTLGVI